MPDAPQHRDLTPESIRREREAKARSPLYWCHECVTVHQYKQMSRAQQDEVNAQCRRIEQAKRK